MFVTLPPINALKILTERPNQMYIALGGKELYVSLPDREVRQFTGTDFSVLTVDEIDKYIHDAINEV